METEKDRGDRTGWLVFEGEVRGEVVEGEDEGWVTNEGFVWAGGGLAIMRLIPES